MIFSKIRDSLEEGTIFSHTDILSAKEFFKEINEPIISIAICGNVSKVDPLKIVRKLNAILSYFEYKSNIKLIFIKGYGLPTILKRYCEKNGIGYDMIPKLPVDDDIVINQSSYENERYERILAMSHAVIEFRQGKNKPNYMYQPAINSGRLVKVFRLR